MKLLLASAAFLVSAHAHAAQVVGNGGDAVVCRDAAGQITRAELYDYYEGRVLRGLHLPAVEAVNEPLQIAKTIVHRWDQLDPARADRLIARLDHFFDEVQLVDSGLTPIPDMGVVLIDPACKIEQAAIFRKPELPYDKQILIAKDIWDHFNNLDRTGLILHELIYEDARTFGHDDSQASRYINALAASEELDDWDQTRYGGLLRQLVLKDEMYRVQKENGAVAVVEAVHQARSARNAASDCAARAPAGLVGSLLGTQFVFTPDGAIVLEKLPLSETPAFRAVMREAPIWWYSPFAGGILSYDASSDTYGEADPGENRETPYPYLCRYEVWK